VIDEANDGGFGAKQAWLYATILTAGYMISRGLAKSGRRDVSGSDKPEPVASRHRTGRLTRAAPGLMTD
jgi:hypothetical protein